MLGGQGLVFGPIPKSSSLGNAAREPDAWKKMSPFRNNDIAKVRQNPVSGCWASFARHRYSEPPARPPHNMEIAIESNGSPSCATANQVTNILTASPTQGP